MMVTFNADHKHELKATSGRYSTIQWFDENGEMGEVDLTKIETDELWRLRQSVQHHYDDQLRVIDAELDSWTEVHCSVCGMEQIAHRGYPFMTWGVRAGYILCPSHLKAYDMMGTPDGERLKKAREEEAEIKELFG